MDNFKIDFLVKEKLQAFDNLEDLTVSIDWETNLDLKLQQVKRPSNTIRTYQVVLVFLALINVGFVLFSLNKKQSDNRMRDMQAITNELLIPDRN